jgi:hypothetical protein
VGYALGRSVLLSDLPLIDRMVKAGGDATFSQLATEIATSRQFRNRLGRKEEAAPVKIATGTPVKKSILPLRGKVDQLQLKTEN